jgi:hypothetical protein
MIKRLQANTDALVLHLELLSKLWKKPAADF